MSLFEAQTGTLRAALASNNTALLTACNREDLPPALASSGLILQNETFCELGGPQNTSALILAYSNELLSDAAYRVGLPPASYQGKHVDFALAAVVSGRNIDEETFYRFTLRFPRLADHPGWMVKTDKTNIWVRVARDAPENALEVAASCLIDRIHLTFPEITGVELYFVINKPTLINTLKSQAEDSRKLLRELKTGVWQGRGFDYESCELSGHCGKCADKKTCASVRKIQAKVNLVRKSKTIN